jgi:hypothetical protein
MRIRFDAMSGTFIVIVILLPIVIAVGRNSRQDGDYEYD